MFWYEEEVVRLENELSRLSYSPETIFYGSSTFTLWETLYSDFEEFKPMNIGFGGSTLAACAWFYERILTPVTSAKTILIYAGDNDLGDGRLPEEVCLFYQQLISRIRGQFGNISCYFISIKPSIKRWEIIEHIKSANNLIKAVVDQDENLYYIDIFQETLNEQGFPRQELFEADGLHLSQAGYAVWKEIILRNISQKN